MPSPFRSLQVTAPTHHHLSIFSLSHFSHARGAPATHRGHRARIKCVCATPAVGVPRDGALLLYLSSSSARERVCAVEIPHTHHTPDWLVCPSQSLGGKKRKSTGQAPAPHIFCLLFQGAAVGGLTAAATVVAASVTTPTVVVPASLVTATVVAPASLIAPAALAGAAARASMGVGVTVVAGTAAAAVAAGVAVVGGGVVVAGGAVVIDAAGAAAGAGAGAASMGAGATTATAAASFSSLRAAGPLAFFAMVPPTQVASSELTGGAAGSATIFSVHWPDGNLSPSATQCVAATDLAKTPCFFMSGLGASARCREQPVPQPVVELLGVEKEGDANGMR